MVIPFAYLWRHERNRGIEEGRKTRPAVIVLVVRDEPADQPKVTVAPITHTKPDHGGEALELPPRVKRALGLDAERSWIVLDEVNQFVWPGYDIRPVPGARDRFAYGLLPPALFEQVVTRIVALARERRIKVVRRD